MKSNRDDTARGALARHARQIADLRQRVRTLEDRLRLLERETHGTIVDTVLRHLARVQPPRVLFDCICTRTISDGGRFQHVEVNPLCREHGTRREATHPAPYDDPNNADA